MAIPLTAFAVFDGTGAPLTTAAPAFGVYKDLGGAARTLPTISNLGGGLYGFTPSQADYDAGTAFLIATGAEPSHYAGAVGALANAFSAHDAATGSPSASASPVFTRWTGTGSAPGIVNLGGGLYGFATPVSDAATGAAFEIDLGAGFGPRYVSGVAQSLTTAAVGLSTVVIPQPPAPVVTPAPGSDLPRDIQIDLTSGDLIFDGRDLSIAKGITGIQQAVRNSLSLIQGEWFLDESAGIPLFDMVLLRNPNLGPVRTMLTRAIEAVPGITEVQSLKLAYEGGSSRTLTVTYAASSDVGELADTVSVQT